MAMVIICIAALGLKLLNFPRAPMLLGVILGGMLKDNLRRALLINDGGLSFMWERPMTAVILGIGILTLAGPPVLAYLRRRFQIRKGQFATDGKY